MKKVKATVTEACYIGGKLRQSGEEVEIREDLVNEFPVEVEKAEKKTEKK